MRSVLTLDDSASIRQMVAFTLKHAGYQVIEAVDGQDALDKLRDQPVDMVLPDQNMPCMDGLASVQRLRGMARHRSVPSLTTGSIDEMEQAGRAAGATGWLVKPFDRPRLLEGIGKVLGR